MKVGTLACFLIIQSVVAAALLFAFWTRSTESQIFFGSLWMVVLTTVCVWLFLQAVRRNRKRFRKRASVLVASRRQLLKQQEALQRIATNAALYQGNLEQALREIAEISAATLGAERVAAWELPGEGGMLHCLNLFRVDSRTHTTAAPLSCADITSLIQELKARRTIVVEDLDSDRKWGAVALLLGTHVRRALVAPVFHNATLAGLVAFGDQKQNRCWTVYEQSFVNSIADTIMVALETGARRRMEEDLKRKSLAIDSAMAGIMMLDRNQQITFVNRSLVQLFGYAAPADLVSKDWRALYDENELDRLRHELMPAFRREGNLRFEASGLRRDGTHFPHEVSLTKIPGDGFICTVNDLSGKKYAEKNYRESLVYLRRVIDANPNFIFVKDPDGRFTLVNQAVADAYGTTVEEILGRTDADFNDNPEEVEHFRRNDRFVIETLQDIFIAEEKITTATGEERWLQTTKRPLTIGDDERVHVLGVATDISERKRLHHQLVQAQKMEAIGQLAGGIAHDFNNLLTGILGYTALLKSTSRGSIEVERAAEMIENTARRAAQLTEQLLGFARKGKNQDIPVDIHTTIKESIALLSRTIEKNIAIVQDLTAEEPLVLGDPVQMQQVILNLAINARDAMRVETGGNDGGELTIGTRLITVPTDRSAQQANLREGSYVEITVHDTGCGIDEAIRDKIFEPFFTTKEPGKGTGMGLAMVYGIVKNHGGSISVESELAQGTTFRVHLPIACSRMPVSGEQAHTAAVAGKGHILIVDDHQIIRDVTSRMLSSLGYDVVTAHDGIEALRYYEENRETVDLIILDMVMPKMGARECLREIRKINPNVRAILSTGYGNNHAVQEIMNDGVLGFVQKPFQLDKLSAVVASVLERPSSLRRPLTSVDQGQPLQV